MRISWKTIERDRRVRTLVRVDTDDHGSHAASTMASMSTAAGMSDFRSIASALLMNEKCRVLLPGSGWGWKDDRDGQPHRVMPFMASGRAVLSETGSG
jgi:hypothetical protein